MSEFQFERDAIVENLVLLEDHARKFPCPFCMEKHASKIIGYAEEIAQGGENGMYEKLAEDARKWRRQVQGAKEHTHAHNPRRYEPSGLTARELASKRKTKGRCRPGSTNLYCRLVRCIKKVEAKGGVESPVAVCRASLTRK